VEQADIEIDVDDRSLLIIWLLFFNSYMYYGRENEIGARPIEADKICILEYANWVLKCHWL